MRFKKHLFALVAVFFLFSTTAHSINSGISSPNFFKKVGNEIQFIDAGYSFAEEVIGGAGMANPITENLDFDGYNLIFDQDGDTAIVNDRDGGILDDEFAIQINGSNDFSFAANIFKILSGSSIRTNDGTDAVAESGGAGSAGDDLNLYTGDGGDGDGFGNGGGGGDVVFTTGNGGQAGANGFMPGTGGDFRIVFGTGASTAKDFGFAGAGGGINWTLGTGGDGVGENRVTGGTGGSLIIAAGQGGDGANDGSGGSGGSLQLTGGQGGPGGETGSAGSGGSVNISGGNASFIDGDEGGSGGSVFLTSGQGTAVGNSAGSSGNIQLSTNSGAFPFAGDVAGGNSGYLQISTGSASMGAGTGAGGASGHMEFITGSAGSSTTTGGNSGYISFVTGTPGDNTDDGQAGNGGEITFTASEGADAISGTGVDNIGGDGGYITFVAGESGNAANGSNSDTGGAAGYISFTTGDGRVDESGGDFSITTGSALGDSGNGGDIVVSLGGGFGGGRDGVFRMAGANEIAAWKMQGTGVFKVEDSGSTDAIYFDHNGTNGVIAVNAGNVYFPEGIIFDEADQSVFNYYRNDSFTPTVTDGGAGTVPVYTTNTGRYTRVDNTISIDVYLNGDGGDEGAGAGQLNVALPFNSGVFHPVGLFPCGSAVNDTAKSILYCELGANDGTVALHYFDTISTTDTFDGANQDNATRTIRLKFSYEI